MGSGASLEDQNQYANSNQNNRIFLDEGVGIEASTLSRKWTQKLSLFRNMDTKKLSDLQDQTEIKKSIRHEQSNKSDDSDSESISDKSFSPEQNKQSQILDKKRSIKPSQYKKITTFQSVSEDESDSDIEERYLNHERRHSKHQNRSYSEESEDEKDDITTNLQQQMNEILDQLSDHNSVDTQGDLQFIEQLDIDQVMQDTKQQKITYPPTYRLRRLYMRSRICEKIPSGQEKKVRFDAKQEEHFEEDEGSLIQRDEEYIEYKPEDFLNQIGISVTCRKGNKKDGPLKCDYMIYSDQFSKVIVLSNGHGEFGQYISNLTYRFIFHQLMHSPLFYTNPQKGLDTIMNKIQNKLQKYIKRKDVEDTYNSLLSGCVLTVVIYRTQKLYIAHLGNNRVLITNEQPTQQGKQKKHLYEPVPIHSPSDNREKARIFNSGGEVRKTQNGEEYVYVRGRLYPQLHVTRSIGDIIAHAIGVSAQTEITIKDIGEWDRFLLISTYNTLEYLDDDEILNHLTGFTLKNIKSACESLYKQAKSSQIVSTGFFDDMCIILLWIGSKDFT